MICATNILVGEKKHAKSICVDGEICVADNLSNPQPVDFNGSTILFTEESKCIKPIASLQSCEENNVSKHRIEVEEAKLYQDVKCLENDQITWNENCMPLSLKLKESCTIYFDSMTHVERNSNVNDEGRMYIYPNVERKGEEGVEQRL